MPWRAGLWPAGRLLHTPGLSNIALLRSGPTLGNTNFLNSLTDADWLTKLLYLSCIFDKINSLYLSLQGKSINILTVNNQIKAFKIIHQWTGRVKSGKMDMFSELSDFLEKNVFSENVVK